MQDLEIKKILQTASPVPECPTDKFVAAFHAQMGDDFSVSSSRGTQFPWKYGAIAASLILAIGIYFTAQNGMLKTAPEQTTIVATANPQSAADEFAAQLVSVDYIEEVVATNDL